MEARFGPWVQGRWRLRPPDASPHVREHVRELLLGPLSGPALFPRSERHIPPLPVGAEADGVDRAALAFALDQLTCCLAGHQVSPPSSVLTRRITTPFGCDAEGFGHVA